GCGGFGRRGRTTARNNHVDATRDEFGRELLHPAVSLTFQPAKLECDIAVLDEFFFPQALAKRCNPVGELAGGPGDEKPDHRHRRLLRACRERPRYRAAEQRDEFAPIHSITSSARASSVAGISSPIALAVLRLITRSYLVGCSTGRSAGFAPLRILS